MKQWERGELIYEGKAKKIYNVVGEPDLIWQEFKDSFTAFNGEKKATMSGKGRLNHEIASIIYKKLADAGVVTHWVADPSDTVTITKRLKMIDLEVVMRNVLAGSTAKKFQIAEGTALEQPLVEFYYKKDELGDPFISDEQALMLKTVRKPEDLKILKEKAQKINQELIRIFAQIEIRLIDFKIEFGYNGQGEIILGDEISPDSCRLWQMGSDEKMDKDRFRRDMGQVLEKYQEVLDRLTKPMEG